MMNIRYFKYFSAYLIHSIAAFSIYMGSYYTYTAIFFVFGFIPFIELFTSADKTNLDAAEEAVAEHDKFYDYLLYLLVPVQFGLLLFFLMRLNSGDLATYEIIGMITAYGMACGLAINTAHELGHRDSKIEKIMSKSLLLTSLYMHFFIEHNRGHHLHVATEEDPATSRYGENIYTFYLRSIYRSWLSAWTLEAKRLKKSGKNVISYTNEMIWYHIIQFTLLALIYVTYGFWTMVFFIISASIGILMLETVNYIEHYGLTRKKNGKRYERTLPIHSWNSSYPIGRMLLLELSRHSDHHYIANRKYQLLRHFDESPQMPTGYPGMMLLALIPFAWFKVMHKQIEDYNTSIQLGTSE